MDAWRKITAFILLVAVALPCTEGRQPVLHRVGGGRYSWQPDVNFTSWASQERFYVGDWLYFGFNKQKFKVLQVNQTSYQNCNDTNFIKNITRGGRDVFNLTEAMTYYFISNRFYCLRGMKLEVIVAPFPVFFPRNNTLPITSNPRSNAPRTRFTHLGLLLAATLAWIIM